jgi:hypothetical protein
LSSSLLNRSLYRIEIKSGEFDAEYLAGLRKKSMQIYEVEEEDLPYLVYTGSVSNNAYSSEDERIQILYHGGELREITEASDMLDVSVLSKTVKKYFVCYPKEAAGTGSK